MYILFEKANSRSNSNHIVEYDCMGYTEDEEMAMKWRDQNEVYRVIKYCPDVEVRIYD